MPVLIGRKTSYNPHQAEKLSISFRKVISATQENLLSHMECQSQQSRMFLSDLTTPLAQLDCS